jgi:hypothetical protein
VDREAVAEEEQVALGDAVADLGLPDLAVQLVGTRTMTDVALAGRVGDAEHALAVVARLLDGLESSRRPTTTLTPESLRFRAWAWPCEP